MKNGKENHLHERLNHHPAPHPRRHLFSKMDQRFLNHRHLQLPNLDRSLRDETFRPGVRQNVRDPHAVNNLGEKTQTRISKPQDPSLQKNLPYQKNLHHRKDLPRPGDLHLGRNFHRQEDLPCRRTPTTGRILTSLEDVDQEEDSTTIGLPERRCTRNLGSPIIWD